MIAEPLAITVFYGNIHIPKDMEGKTMTKKELATAIINSDCRKDWDGWLKEAEIRKLMRDPKAQLEKVYNYRLERGEIR